MCTLINMHDTRRQTHISICACIYIYRDTLGSSVDASCATVDVSCRCACSALCAVFSTLTLVGIVLASFAGLVASRKADSSAIRVSTSSSSCAYSSLPASAFVQNA